MTSRVRTVLNSRKSLQTWKSLEKWWNVECFLSGIFSVLVKSYSISPVRFQRIMKKALFLSLLRSLLITFDDIESGKRKYCFGKKSGNGLEFGIPKCVQTLQIQKWLDILGVRFFGRIHRRICDLVWILRQQKAENAKKDHLPWQRHVLMLLAMTRNKGKNNKLILVMKTRRKSNKHELRINIRNAYISAWNKRFSQRKHLRIVKF